MSVDVELLVDFVVSLGDEIVNLNQAPLIWAAV